MEQDSALSAPANIGSVSISDGAIDLIGSMIAEAYLEIKSVVDRRRGALSLLRLFASAAAELVLLLLDLTIRRRATTQNHQVKAFSAVSIRHLQHPPQGWAAP
jgi:predicted permease